MVAVGKVINMEIHVEQNYSFPSPELQLGEGCYGSFHPSCSMQWIGLLPSAPLYLNDPTLEDGRKKAWWDPEIRWNSFWENSLKPGNLQSNWRVWVRQQKSQWYKDKALTWDVGDPGSSPSSAAFREGFEPPPLAPWVSVLSSELWSQRAKKELITT